MPVLALRNVSKHFGAIEALAGVDLTMEAGEIVGLMGDNGAGKSTLVKIVAGNFPPSGGEIEIAGKNVHFRKPVEARGEGIEVVYQDLALAPELTPSENLFLGREKLRPGLLGRLGFLDRGAMRRMSALLTLSMLST